MNIKEIDVNKWDKLIEEHYLSCLKRNPNYENKYSRKEMKEWWYSKFDRVSEDIIESFILGSTHANNNGYHYHPV